MGSAILVFVMPWVVLVIGMLVHDAAKELSNRRGRS